MVSSTEDGERSDVHPVEKLLRAAADGRFPSATGAVEVASTCPPGTVEWVVSTTGYSLVATSRPAPTVLAQGMDGFGGTLSPAFLLWLAGPGGQVGCQDAVLVALGTSGPGLPPRDDLDEHPRVCHARSLRSGVAVAGDATGLVTVGVGLGGLHEMSVEVTTDRGRGHGRHLIQRGLSMVPLGEPVIAQVTPGNARSLRAFLAAGFAPVGSAVAITPGRR